MEGLQQEVDRLLDIVKQQMIDRKAGVDRSRALVRISGGL